MTEPRLELGVYRRLDNRAEGLDDQSEFAWELHRRRRAALQDAFAPGSGIDVIDWGGEVCDETRTHELAELIVVVNFAVEQVIVPGAQLLADKLVGLGVDAVLAKAAKAVWSKLRPKQKDKQIYDYMIMFPDGTQVHALAPEQGSAAVTITSGGHSVEITPQQLAAAR